MILAIVTTSAGEEIPFIRNTVPDIMSDIASNMDEFEDYKFEDIVWYNLGNKIKVTRDTSYLIHQM